MRVYSSKWVQMIFLSLLQVIWWLDDLLQILGNKGLIEDLCGSLDNSGDY